MLLALLLIAAPLEDAAHRADRQRTEALNDQVARATDRRLRESARRRAAYARAREDWERDMEQWRRRSADCRAGQAAAC